MRIVRGYLLREALTHFGLGLLLFTFVIFMRDAGELIELLVRSSSFAVLAIFLDLLPSALVFTLPMAVLVGILIGLGRLSGDNELTAFRAVGVNGRQLAVPLLGFAVAVGALTGAFSLWIAPAGARHLLTMEAHLRNSQIASAVQPRVFLEDIPQMVVYVGDTRNGGRDWRDVFVASVQNPASPTITLARRGQLLAHGPNELQLHLEDGAEYDNSAVRPATLTATSFASIDIPVALAPAPTTVKAIPALATGALWRRAQIGADWRAARIEIYRRFALAFGCLAMALLGIPLGLRAKRGKAGGFVLTLLLVFGYYIAFILGIALARQGRLPPSVGVWAANVICAGVGLWLLSRTEALSRGLQSSPDPAARLRDSVTRWLRRRPSRDVRPARGWWLPWLLDGYVIREFLGYVGLMLASFLVLVLTFTFFELLGDMIRTRTDLAVMLEYLFYLTPDLLYVLAPVAILVGVLVTFGLMSKANEITAMKACGIGIYRLLVPVCVVAALLAVLQFGLDQSFLPSFNRKQDALRAVIKGRPAQTFERPERKWIFGQDNDIFYFQYFDPSRDAFSNISVFSFNPDSFQLTRRIYAHSSYWDNRLGAWIFEQGWVRDIHGVTATDFQRFEIASFPRLRERPDYFKTDSRESSQMSFTELRRYVNELRHGGYDVGRLAVQLDKKVAYPAITLIMALLAFPFALSVGRRGTVTGIVLAIGVAIVYWVSSGFLEALGNLDQIPAPVAAWFPDLLFALAGIYFLLRVPT